MKVFEVYVELAHEATKEIAGGRLDYVEIKTCPRYQKTGRKHRTSAASLRLLEWLLSLLYDFEGT
jgi:hypothetical protein